MIKEELVFIYNGILVIRKNMNLLFATKQMDWEGMMCSETNQRRTNTVCFHLYVESKNEYKIYKDMKTKQHTPRQSMGQRGNSKQNFLK